MVLKFPAKVKFSTNAPSKAPNKPTPQSLEENERFEIVLKFPLKTPLKASASFGVRSHLLPIGELVFADEKSRFCVIENTTPEFPP